MNHARRWLRQPLLQQLLLQMQQPTRGRHFMKRITGSIGDTRPRDRHKVMPEANKYRYQSLPPPDGRYTTRPLRVRHLGGRDPETGRVVVRTIRRGNQKLERMVDHRRHAPEGETVEEKVYLVRYCPLHTFLLALVAGSSGQRRWIMAGEETKPGDVVRTINVLPRKPMRVREGDAYPIGAMPPGTLVHNVERLVGEGGYYCQYAGAHATVGKRLDSRSVLVTLASGQPLALDERCMAVVGKGSNTQHRLINRLCPQRSVWKGDRPVSGLWHRKDGWCGRKLHPPKQLLTFFSQRKLLPHEPPSDDTTTLDPH